MGTMGCNEFMEQLDSWMEGDRYPAARTHAQHCPSCGSFAADLDAIQAAAPTLAVADPEPSERVWAALRIQLKQEGLIRDDVEIVSPPARFRFAELFSALPRPALAGGYLAVLVAVAFGLSGPFAVRIAQPLSFPFSAQLDNAELTTISSVGGSKSLVSAAFHQNLLIVDNYISLCEKSVRAEPDNEMVREYLYGAYQQKADLLAQMTERGDSIP
jgi:hypothetical protein